jgi:hypothetical protein
MSEQLELRSGSEIRDWAKKNGFDVVNLESDAPRFFQPRFTPMPGPMLLFSIEHTYLTKDGQPMVSVNRIIRSTSAEDALYQYFQEPKERSSGSAEYSVGFRVHMKPGANDNEAIVVIKHTAE